LLFPSATDAQFADGYAQAVTFGLLIARAFDIPLDKGVEQAAFTLKKSSSLIGTALALLTDSDETREALSCALNTLTRVLHEVNWHIISKDKADAWLYFYEDFLEIYDNRLRKLTGSYLHAAAGGRGHGAAGGRGFARAVVRTPGGAGLRRCDFGRSGGGHGDFPARRAAPHREKCRGGSGQGRGASGLAGGGEAYLWV
jgi:hypothetical protein